MSEENPEYVQPETVGDVPLPDHDTGTTGALSESDIDALIERRLAEVEERHAKEMQALRDSTAGTAFSTIPSHAGGVGQEIAATWGQHDQMLATRGEHPDQVE